MVDKIVGRQQDLSLKDWENLANDMKANEHLRTKVTGEGNKLYTKAKHGSTLRPSWMAMRRTKFTNTKLLLRRSMVDHLMKNTRMGSQEASEKADEILASTLSGGKKLNRGRFLCCGPMIHGHVALKKSDIKAVLDSTAAAVLDCKSMQEVSQKTIQRGQDAIKSDDPHHNVGRTKDAAVSKKSIKTINNYDPQMKQYVQEKMEGFMEEYARQVVQDGAEKGDLDAYLSKRILSDPKLAALYYECSEGTYCSENVALQVELKKLGELLEDPNQAQAAEQKFQHIFNTYVVQGGSRMVNFGDQQKNRDLVCNRQTRQPVQQNARDFHTAMTTGVVGTNLGKFCSQPITDFVVAFGVSRKVLDQKIQQIEQNAVPLKPAKDVALYGGNSPLKLPAQIQNLVGDIRQLPPIQAKKVMQYAIAANNFVRQGKSEQAKQAIKLAQVHLNKARQTNARLEFQFVTLGQQVSQMPENVRPQMKQIVENGLQLLEQGAHGPAGKLLRSAQNLQVLSATRQQQLNVLEQFIMGRLNQYDISVSDKNQMLKGLDELKRKAPTENITNDARILREFTISSVSRAILEDSNSTVDLKEIDARSDASDIEDYYIKPEVVTIGGDQDGRKTAFV